MLAEVKATGDQLEEVAGCPRRPRDRRRRARQAGRAPRGLARLGGELQVAREQLEQAAEEALGARTQAATASEAAAAARDDARLRPGGRSSSCGARSPRAASASRASAPTSAPLSVAHDGREKESPDVYATFTLLRADLGANREQMDALR